MGERKTHTNWELELSDVKEILKQRVNDPHSSLPVSSRITEIYVRESKHAPMKPGRYLMRVSSEADGKAPARKWQCRKWEQKGDIDMRRMRGVTPEKMILEARQIRMQGEEEWMAIVVTGGDSEEEEEEENLSFLDGLSLNENHSPEVKDDCLPLEEEEMKDISRRFMDQETGITSNGVFQFRNVQKWMNDFPGLIVDSNHGGSPTLDVGQLMCLLFQSTQSLQKQVENHEDRLNASDFS